MTVQNTGEDEINGIFVSIFLPNDVAISEFTFSGIYEKSIPDTVYPDSTAYRFVFEEPQDFGKFPLNPDQKVTIDFHTDADIDWFQMHFTGYITNRKDPIFGYN